MAWVIMTSFPVHLLCPLCSCPMTSCVSTPCCAVKQCRNCAMDKFSEDPVTGDVRPERCWSCKADTIRCEDMGVVAEVERLVAEAIRETTGKVKENPSSTILEESTWASVQIKTEIKTEPVEERDSKSEFVEEENTEFCFLENNDLQQEREAMMTDFVVGQVISTKDGFVLRTAGNIARFG